MIEVVFILLFILLQEIVDPFTKGPLLLWSYMMSTLFVPIVYVYHDLTRFVPNGVNPAIG
jgi:hypothetical protein